MFKTIPFEEHYLTGFIYDGVEKDVLAEYDIIELAKAYSLTGDAFMGLIDDKLMGMGGIYPVFGGIGQAWIFLNQITQEHKKTVFKEIIRYMEHIISKSRFKEIQISCIKNSEEANRLAEHLGFVKKTELIMYTRRNL